jgi:MtrB/PioB family decaheme-associated outer membrane protein
MGQAAGRRIVRDAHRPRHRGPRWTAAALWLLAATPGSGGAETEVGDLLLTGHVEAGAVILEGDNDSGKFDEYRRYRSNAVGNGFFLLENEARSHYLLGEIDFISDKDQRYELGAGRWGHYGIELEYMEFPHTYSNNGFTPYNESFNGKLFLPNSWYTDLANNGGDLRQTINDLGESRGLKFRQINGRADAFYRPDESWEFTAGYSVQDKRGTHPGYMSFGFSDFVTFAEPLDERIHQLSGGGSYSGEGWSLGLDYHGSFFDNQLDNITADNPLQEMDASTASHTGRRSIAPDNSAHQFALSGAAVLPTSFPSRLAGTFSYGIRLQDDKFLPHTSNTAFDPLDQTSSLKQSDLDGEVQTILANLVYTARPTPELNVEARYRLYDLDNDSDSITFDERVQQDRRVSTGASTVRSDFRRQNVDLEASYRLADPATLQLAFGWENWERSQNRSVRHSNEYKGSVGLLLRPSDWMRFQTSYEVSARDGNRYYSVSGQDPELRRFDEADRIRNALLGRVFLDLSEDLNASLFGGFHFDDYEDTEFGLRDGNGWNAGAELAYQPLDWLGFSAWYNFDYLVWKQRSTSTSGPWRGRSKDQAHDVGAQADVTIVPEYLDWAVSYHFQRGDADTNASGGAAVDYPDIDDTLHTVTNSLTYHLLEKLDLIAAWTYEDWSHNNFQTDPLGVNFPPDDDIYLNNRIDDYDAHIIMLSARYEF